ncbi:MAG: D-glycero-beta-D-manno-heptose 1-phosphate adenylyltransferase, partial [bacterium]|nr:D-glycero-beta-D-manno-heptose 1-phosphate adenylyltransferase [bacterium]
MEKTQTRILPPPELAEVISAAQGRGLKVVFTNGCFDILHAGHVRYLEEARALGDILVVGVNSNRSAATLEKGSGRPVNGERERAEVLAALRSVDFITIFDEDTPYELIKLLQPDVLVKGGDWAVEDIVGSDIVLARGGAVKSLQFAPGFSTTDSLRKIQNEVELP